MRKIEKLYITEAVRGQTQYEYATFENWKGILRVWLNGKKVGFMNHNPNKNHNNKWFHIYRTPKKNGELKVLVALSPERKQTEVGK